jgi:hypothetical protein
MEGLGTESGPLARWLAALCLTVILSTRLLGDEKTKKLPAVQPTPTPKVYSVKVTLLPDLAITWWKSWVMPGTGAHLYAIVKNVGQAKAGSSSLSVTCDRYQGSMKVGPCLASSSSGVKELEPGQSDSVHAAYLPGIAGKCKYGEVTLCRVRGTVSGRRGMKETSAVNNEKLWDYIPPKPLQWPTP